MHPHFYMSEKPRGGKITSFEHFSPGVQYCCPPLWVPIRALSPRCLGVSEGRVPQSLLLLAERLWANYQIYATVVLSSPTGAAPWIAAFLSEGPHRWEMPWKGCLLCGWHEIFLPYLFLTPFTGKDNELRFLYPVIIDTVAGKCLLVFLPVSKVTLLTRRSSDIRHQCSLCGGVG